MSVPYPVTPEEIKHAEAVLLGSLLFYPEQGTLVHTVLQPEDFSEDRHRLIYEALQAIPGSHALESLHAVKILLSDRELEQIGGEAVLLDAETTGRKHNDLHRGPGLSPQTVIFPPLAHACW